MFGGGQVNQFRATMYRRDDPEKKALYVIAGSWSDKFSIYRGDSSEVVETWDQDQKAKTMVEARCDPIEDQDSWETRKAWQFVTTALRKGDFGSAVEEKSKVEQAQRWVRLNEKKGGTVWKSLLFSPLRGAYDVFESLASAFDCKLEADKTKGCGRSTETS